MAEEHRWLRVAVRLDPETQRDVARLAAHWRTSTSGVIRQAVAAAARRELGEQPGSSDRERARGRYG